MKSLLRSLLACIALSVTVHAFAASATLVRETELKDAPASDAGTLAQLAAEESVQTFERRGGWMRIRSAAGKEGWVKMLLLRFAPGSETREGSSGIGQAFNVARGGTSGGQVTTGVRGLDAESLTSARPNPRELQRLDAFAVGADEARSFAAEGALEARSIDYPRDE